MMKFIPFISFLVLLIACQKTEQDECIPPSDVSRAYPNCFHSENGLWVAALNSKISSDGGQFFLTFYPQTDPENIDMSEANETFANAGGAQIFIPAEMLEGVNLFAIRMELFCVGLLVGEVKALFELMPADEACNKWVITLL